MSFTLLIDCDNKDESIESILKKLISVDDDGNYYLNVIAHDPIP